MNPSFLTSAQLASRWHITTKTLSRWRYAGQGPHFHKISGNVTYSIPDIEDFEMRNRRRCTSEYDLKLPKNSDQTDKTQNVPPAKRKDLK
jgi:hypothetical protein